MQDLGIAEGAETGGGRRAVLIAGPTASGKSALALALAEELGGTVINADSMQVYEGLRILSARPTQEEEARAPHRLYGHVPPSERYTVARWLADATRAIAEVREEGRVPIVVGGMDSVPPMLVSPFQGHEDINVLQIDAHIDFRDEINGRRDGFSIPMRRLLDHSCVHDLVQVGARSIGSARREEVEAALKAGNRIVTAWEVHESGAKPVADSLDLSRRWVVSLDCDGMDPTIAPGVGVPEPGGLTFVQTAILLNHLARNGRLAGIVFIEFQPARDVNNTTALTIVRLILNIIGLQRRPGR